MTNNKQMMQEKITTYEDNIVIFVVDDEPSSLMILKKLLDKNYHVELLETGEACMQQLQTIKPDLILLDINMPGISGLEVCKLVKENPLTEDIPIIFVSTLSHADDIKAGYQAGGDDYVSKPFKLSEIMAKIELALKSRILA